MKGKYEGDLDKESMNTHTVVVEAMKRMREEAGIMSLHPSLQGTSGICGGYEEDEGGGWYNEPPSITVGYQWYMWRL